jgi:hypothetical protein
VEAGAAAANLDIVLGLPGFDLDRGIGERASDLGEEAAREQGGALALDLGVQRRLEPEVEVGGGEGDAPFLSGKEDPGERLGGGAGGDSPGDGRELGDEIFPFGRELQDDECLLKLS